MSTREGFAMVLEVPRGTAVSAGPVTVTWPDGRSVVCKPAMADFRPIGEFMDMLARATEQKP